MNEFFTVYSAEITRRLRSRIFIVGLLVGAIGIAALLKLPSYMESFVGESRRIAVAGDPALVAQGVPLLRRDYNIVRTMPGKTRVGKADLGDAKHVSAIAVLLRTAHGVRAVVYARDPGAVNSTTMRRDLLPLTLRLATGLSQNGVNAALNIPIDVRATNSKFGNASQANDARVIAFLLLFLLYLLIMVNSQLIISSVAEEKTSRIAELLVASVDPSALLAGKIAASATLAVLQMFVWIAIGFALGAHPAGASALGGADTARETTFSISSVSAADLAGFGAFFILGFLQMSTLFAAVGSLVNRTEDLGALAGPLVLPIVAAFVIAMTALGAPNAPIVVLTSFIPLVSPFVMFARIVISEVPLWQIALALAINITATWGIAILGGKIYRVGMLLYGRAPKLTQIWSVLRS